MTHSSAVLVALAVTASLAVGWYGAKAWLAHEDLDGTLRRLARLKKSRSSNGRIVLLVIIVALVFFLKIMH